MAVTFTERRAARLHHARQAAGQLVRPGVHERVLRGGRSGRRRQHPRGDRPERKPQVLLRRRRHQEVPRGRRRREHGDDQGQPGRVPADGGRAAGVHRVHRRSRARRRARGHAGLRHPPGRRRLLPAGSARGHARAAPRQRRDPAADAAHRPEPGARAADHRPHLCRRGGARDGAGGGGVRRGRRRGAGPRVRGQARRRARRWRSPRSSGACTRAASCRSPTGSRSRPS